MGQAESDRQERNLAHFTDFTHFIEAGTPHGSVALRISRFRNHTTRSRVGAVVDDLFSEGEGEGPKAPAGLTLEFVDASGRALRSLTLHPIEHGLEDRLLPASVAAAHAGQVTLQILAKPAGLGAPLQIVDTLHPLMPPSSSAVYRQGLLPAPTQALNTLVHAGFSIEDAGPRTFHAVRMTEKRRNLFWLLMLPPIILFAPVFVVLERSLKGIINMIRTVLGNSFLNRKESLSWHVRGGTLEVLKESQPGERDQMELPLQDVVALAYGPNGVEVESSDGGRLRAITREGCVGVSHAFAMHNVPKEKADSRTQRTRELARALREVLQWLVLSQRG